MDDAQQIDLKDPVLAAMLAWLLPGLGHWYQGRRAKASLYFVCIMGLFVLGIFLSSSRKPCLDGQSAIGGGRAVYFSWRDTDRRLAYICQIGVGLPALPALVQAYRMSRDRKVWWGGFMAPPRLPEMSRIAREDPNADQPTPNDLYRMDYNFELATFFTMIAGLLNVLAIYDALAGPVAAAPIQKEESDSRDG